MKTVLALIGVFLVVALATGAWFMFDAKQANETIVAASLPVRGRMPSLDAATAWINSEPLTDASLRGKVVLIDFWTYSCINWRRELPYVRAWSEKYKDKGLVVIGVHTPEFAFEKDIGNIRWAVNDFNVPYPVAVDSEYRIWSAFNNRYWPALYFVDTRGNIRHMQFGEGDYDKSERAIQQLLRESGASVDDDLATPKPEGAEAQANWTTLRSPEIYLGSDRQSGFSSSEGIFPDEDKWYRAVEDLRLNTWTLGGRWTVASQEAKSNEPGGLVRVRFHARDVHLVMGPVSKAVPIRFRLLIDGKPPGDSRGLDVDSDGNGVIGEPRMYQLIRQPGEIQDRTVQIEFLDSGAAIYSFTFG
jgi:thiol-disulfide isomerase/thioredoxin